MLIQLPWAPNNNSRMRKCQLWNQLGIQYPVSSKFNYFLKWAVLWLNSHLKTGLVTVAVSLSPLRSTVTYKDKRFTILCVFPSFSAASTAPITPHSWHQLWLLFHLLQHLFLLFIRWRSPYSIKSAAHLQLARGWMPPLPALGDILMYLT